MINNYPHTSLQDMNLDWIIAKVKELAQDWASKSENWDKWQKDTNEAFVDLKSYVMNYFDNLDVQEEIDKKLDEMKKDGTLEKIIEPFLSKYIQPEFVDSINEMININKTYILKSNGHVYYYDGNNFIDSGYTYSLPTGITINNGLVASYNYKTMLPDVNNVTNNSSYLLLFAVNSTEIPENLPFNTWEDTDPVLLYTITNLASQTGNTQYLITNTKFYYRTFSNSWKNWNLVYDKNNYTINNGLVASYNYKTMLPDVNNVTNNSSYLLLFAVNSTEIPENLPFNTWEDTDPVLLCTITNLTSQTGNTQYLITNTKFYYRTFSNSWKNWNLVYDKNNYKYTIECNENDNFVKIAYENIGNKIIVKGTHNLFEEFLDYKGTTYFDDYTVAKGQGIPLQNGSEIIGNGDAVLVFNYTGDNNNVKHDFSPFFCDSGDSTIDGIEINATNCRYCIHDEHSGSTLEYRSIIKNCRLILNNKNNDVWNSKQTIGGGLGQNATIIIENNYLDGNSNYINDIVASYHNSFKSDALSYGIFSNNYIKKGTFRCGYYGDSTKITRFLVSNNHLTNEPILIKEGNYENINMEIISYNNEITN